MPLIRKAIVIDPLRCAEGQSPVGAARKHHVGCRSPGRLDTGQHIDVVVSYAAGVVDRQEHLPTKSYAIYPTLNDGATEANSGVSVKSRCLPSNLRVARTLAAKRRAPAPTTNKKVAVRIYIERSIYRRIGNNDRRLPGDTAVSGALKYRAAVIAIGVVISLVLKAMSRAVGLIDSEPLLVASSASVG